MHDFHGAATEYIARTHHQGITDFLGVIEGFAFGARGAVRRLTQIKLVEQFLETLTILRDIDRLGAGADNRCAVGLERASEFQGGLAAVLDNDAHRFFLVDDFKYVLQGQRLEIQTIRGVVIGRDGLRVAIDHDGFITIFTQGESRVHAAIVKLDALPDTVGTASEHHDFFTIGGCGLALLFVRRVEIRRIGRELGRAGINTLVHGTHVVQVT